MTYLKTHVFYVCLIVVFSLAGYYWVQEHDARVVAEQVAKQSEADVKTLQASVQTLQQQITSNDAKAAADKAALLKALAAVKTPAQAVAALPDVSNLPLHSRISVDNPTQVSVDAVPLFQELNQCKQDAVDLTACRSDLTAQKQIDADKDKQLADKNTEIAALKKKPSVWKRVLGRIKSGVIDFAIFEGLRVATTRHL